MRETVILLFRDLVTQPQETIDFHRDKIVEHDYCWWGWWKKQIEDVPIQLLSHLAQLAAHNEEQHSVFLFDCGSHRLYEADLLGVEIAASDEAMRSPEIDKTPEYYVHLRCAVWLKFSAIRDVSNVPKLLSNMTYISFPTWRNNRYDDFCGKIIGSTTELDEMLVTLWHVCVHDEEDEKQLALPIDT
jgi:hypothetical protein